MNIAFVSYTYWPPYFGGELRLAIERLETLARRGHRVVVFTSGAPGFPREERSQGLRVLRSPVIGTTRGARLARRAVFLIWTLKHLQKECYDAVHFGSMPGVDLSTDALSAFFLAGIARRKGARTVTVHALADSESAALDLSGTKGFWKRVYYLNMDHIVAVSPALYQPLAKWWPDKTLLVPYAVRDEVFKPLPHNERLRLRRERGIPENGVVFLFLGSVGRRKGFDLLAQAFARLAPKYPNWYLWVIGPRTRAESQNLDEIEVREVSAPLASLKDRVRWWGRVDDRHELARIMGAGDVFVFPSRREGMGLAPMEAMAMGLPVIISRIPGVTDLANVEGETGIYVPVGDTNALEVAMERLGTDSELRQRMGQKAVQRIREAFSWDPYIDKWERLYLEGCV
mgnify:FL=1